ncbi:MAG: TlpA family protein disulfide reductase [Cytophagaceae bacterium]|nr:TlpA family protein disulfide reductase [Cytophagaceae bacterium]MBK9510439.1 TlpA family protein disulfide reductase [Cytophagaceae bacterium]MBK9935968.1 TlpA family protein disulfide reductase [Cytophagaceae bacterium]MBL0304149.1 TlpA family protein disulfide reductase [Cytophagaceae bacterium]MBL0326958.1 TlpA family protein disulfide reductase [Cytophagaceae bacterium]
MKITIQYLLIGIILLSSCGQNRRPKPDFYKNLYTQEILNKTQYLELIKSLSAKYNDSTKTIPDIKIHFKSLEISNDSIIQPFKYDVRIGNEYIVRADSFEKIGMKISPKTFLTTNGERIQIGGKQTKPTLINLWFVECGGCVAEIPALNKLQENYADKVNFIAITFDDDKKVLRFLKNKEFNFKHITNANQFIEYIGTKPYPENIFIDKDGFIRNIEGGLGKNEDLDLETKYFGSIIEKLLLPTTKASKQNSASYSTTKNTKF